MLAFFTSLFGTKWAKPAMYLALAVGLVILLTLGKCALDRGKSAQAEQGVRSSEALAKSAEKAVETVVNANSRDASIDQIVTQTAQEIDNAATPEMARAAALSAVCGLPEYRADPACAVFKPNP